MRDKQSRRLFTAILCITISIFGLIFTFGNGNGEEAEEEEKNSRREGKSYEYAQEELPQDENESQDETYTDGKSIKVYFTNTEKLDRSSLPLAAHAILCREAQKYLDAGGFENAGDLRILDNGFSDSKDAITFRKRKGSEENDCIHNREHILPNHKKHSGICRGTDHAGGNIRGN